jgi:2-oxoglutarate ferredoxin oxidoreductase subunit gamma
MNSNRFYYNLVISGFGGQGVLVIGNLLAHAAMKEGRHVTFLPIYGVEMRGGTANCTVVVSSREIGSPVIERPHGAILMNLPSLVKYQSRVLSKGLMLYNSSLIDPIEANRQDVELLPIPVNDIAIENGNPKLSNMVALGAFIEKTNLIKMSSLFESLEKVIDERYHSLIPSNIKAIEKGAQFVKTLIQSSP